MINNLADVIKYFEKQKNLKPFFKIKSDIKKNKIYLN